MRAKSEERGGKREEGRARRVWRLALGAWCLCALAAGAATPNVDLGAHTFVGLLKESGNRVVGASAGATVKLVSSSGRVLAKAKVSDATATGYNFVLPVPLSLNGSEDTAKAGEKLNCVVETPEGKSIATGQLTVGEPADVTSGVNLLMVDEQRFTNQKTGETVGVPSAYLDEISPWLEFYGIKYDPWDDPDHDGVCNYLEYLAGTDAFDGTHKLRITGFRASAELHEISFEYVGGHLYGVAATPDLTKPAWTQRKVRPTPDGEEQAAVLPSAEQDDVGETTIYVVPASDKPCEFFKLEPR